MILISQSGVASDSDAPEGRTETSVAPMSRQEITAFADQDAGWLQTIEGTYDSTMDLAKNDDSTLGSFLKRPIRQSAQTWLVGQGLHYKFNPWQAFCENPYVRDKIKNYQLLRMKLHCKMVISGTKFHYGRSLVSYNPFTWGDEVTVDRAFIPQDNIQASQKPHFFLNPTKNTGGELCLPFFWDKNYLNIPAGDWKDMGEIVINSFGNLLHANGGNDPVTVTIYLWAEDVVLTMPTNSDPPLVSQSGRRRARALNSRDQGNSIASDEYGTGIISKPAAAIARAAGQLSSLPVIGPYMTASQIAAGATANIAKTFGYSRPAVITDTQIMKPSPTGNLAATDAADAVIKLTLDSKAELTVDSRTVGLAGQDEMGITEYCMRESYLTSFSWGPDQAPDSLLWNTRVLPMQLDNVNDEIHMTPLAHMATCFGNWQGSLKFRFQIVKSDFHKGRILARWDPNFFTSSVNYNTNYSRVIDIAETDDFEIVVGWGQSSPWKECGSPFATGSNFSAVSRLYTSDTQANGVLELAVLNELVSPSIDAPISINVFVSACDDFKLANPTNSKLNYFHLFPVPPTEPNRNGVQDDALGPGGQGQVQNVGLGPFLPAGGIGDPSNGEYDVLTSQSSEPNVETGDSTESDKPTSSGEIISIASKSDPDDNTYMVYYGDPPTSIRELCKRYCFTRMWFPERASTGAIRINGLTNKDLPYHTGWDPHGIDTSTVTGNPLTVGPTAFHSWFLPAYAGYRGGMRKKYFFTGNLKQSPQVSRSLYHTYGNGSSTDLELSATQSNAERQKFYSSRWNSSAGTGTAATNMSINDTIEVELPFYWNRRFAASRQIRAQTLQCNSHRVVTTAATISGEAQNQDTLGLFYQQHDAVADDFSLFFFTGVPIYYFYSLNETS
ncbi:hypothetical protein 2 [Beihai picorna-like virus 35]|uniref:hypothetical protein 2 n=1 Tax=Beihai picorna-like virus 35 TaxID=1922578 RepID=UPI00090C7289|nr:hypothetical protein 2 [Beihai picorna-like virus 35]APG76711.1 hypothetical protein 2 [Beihai picorna-like virus 35]APG76753.1 hypothetical protein 2 [Beihai picorna-like virus 35]APG76784.1 hypothetical protein 2 [Beihai picorna-like virus 35]APG76824.1 hypothetical protein 2 [Beihai picorna-like virus 35]APG76878.1 hypothetical protein 2 [Beihai picorna-like virus 35]